jgi:RimJ/RimL family protein N-acetyltransferase
VFQRPILGVASYNAPPAFSDRWKGFFFVPFAPDGASEAEIQGRLAGNSYGSIPTTAVHETYPGHHWHLVMRKANPSDVRRVYSTPYFSEGWALYAERAMRERGFFETPIQELHHLTATLFRAARIVVDTSLHLGEMSFDEAVEFMMDRAAMPEPVAKAEVGRYCWWPTQASSYLTGCLEILAIRERYLGARSWRRGGSRCPDRSPARLPRRDHVLGRPAAGPRRPRSDVDAGLRTAMGHPWPLFDLRIRTPRLELRAPTDDDLLALLEVARAGVHHPERMPFAVAWTDVPSPEFERSFLRFFWAARATWSTAEWRLPLAVLHAGRPVGIQEVMATDFATLRTVDTGSWLGRAHQGHGIGTEMRAAVLWLAFEGLGAEVATAAALEGNDASRRVSAKLGYEPNGEALVAPRGTPVTEHRYLLRRERWRRDLFPVGIEHLDACLPMFGLPDRAT